MTDLKKTMIEIKTLLTTKQPDSDYPTQLSFIASHMNVDASIGDVIRPGRYDENKTRTILLKVPNACQRRMILLSSRKLKNSPQPIFLSR